MDKPDKIFVDGMSFQLPTEKAIAIGVMGKVSFKVAEFVSFLKEHETNSGWVNVDVKLAKSGKYYCELNTYVKQAPPATLNKAGDAVDASNVPF